MQQAVCLLQMVGVKSLGILDPQRGAGLNTGGPMAPVPSLGGSSTPTQHLPMLDALHQQSQARYAQASKADKLMSTARGVFDKLASMGDAVTQDDVLDGFADAVAKGLDPKQLTSLMSGNAQTGAPPMPETGAPLATWLQQQDQILAGHQQQLDQHVQLQRHEMGVAAMHALVGHHVEVTHPPAAQQAALEGPGGPSSPLTPGAPTNG